MSVEGHGPVGLGGPDGHPGRPTEHDGESLLSVAISLSPLKKISTFTPALFAIRSKYWQPDKLTTTWIAQRPFRRRDDLESNPANKRA